MTWSADSNTLCIPVNGLPVLFDISNGERLASLTATDAEPKAVLAGCVAYSPDGRWLAAAQSKQVRIWDATTRKHVRTFATEFSLVHSLAWHKDSQLLAVCGEGANAQILDTVRPAVGGQKLPDFIARYVTWSPDGVELVGGGW